MANLDLLLFTKVNADSDGSIAIELPCADGQRGESIEPISIAFTAVFGVLLVSLNCIRKINWTV